VAGAAQKVFVNNKLSERNMMKKEDDDDGKYWARYVSHSL